METEKKCDNCGANMKIWKNRLTPGLVDTLAVFGKAVMASKKNDVEFRNVPWQNFTQRNNFQKLRYWGFVAHVTENGEKVYGRWLLTRRGAQFLRGQIEVNKEVSTWRNHIESRSDEMCFIGQIKNHTNTSEYFQQEFEYEIHQPTLV